MSRVASLLAFLIAFAFAAPVRADDLVRPGQSAATEGSTQLATTPGQTVLVNAPDGTLTEARVLSFTADGRAVIQERGADGQLAQRTVDTAQLTVRRNVGDSVLIRNADGSTSVSGIITRLEPDGSAVVLSTNREGGLTARVVSERDLVRAPTRLEAEADALRWLASRDVNPMCGTMNCGGTTRALDLNLAGYSASSALFDGMSFNELLAKYPGAIARPTPNGIADIVRDFEAAGPGSRGLVFAQRAGQPGHFFNVVNWQGQVIFLDGQSGHIADLSARQGYVAFNYARTDTVPVVIQAPPGQRGNPGQQGQPTTGELTDTEGHPVTRTDTPPLHAPAIPPVVDPRDGDNHDGERGDGPDHDSNRSLISKIPKAGWIGPVIGALTSIGSGKDEYDASRNRGDNMLVASLHAGGQLLDGVTIGIGPAMKEEYSLARNEGQSVLMSSVHSAGQIVDKVTMGIGPATKDEYSKSRDAGQNMLVASTHAAGQTLDILTLGTGPRMKDAYSQSRDAGQNTLVASTHAAGQLLDTVTLGVGPAATEGYRESRNEGDNMLVATGKGLVSGLGSLLGF